MSRLTPRIRSAEEGGTTQPVEITGLRCLACALLFCTAIMLSACPVPDFEIDPGLNSPIEVQDELVTPQEGVLSATRTVSFATVGPASSVEHTGAVGNFLLWQLLAWFASKITPAAA